MSEKWKYFILGYVWSLPTTLLGLLVVVLFYRPKSWYWSDGCIEVVAGTKQDGSTTIWGKPGAQTLGIVIVYANSVYRLAPHLRIHERVHVTWVLILGPLFLPVYGIMYLAERIRGRGHIAAYWMHPMEVQAYRLQGNKGAWGSK